MEQTRRPADGSLMDKPAELDTFTQTTADELLAEQGPIEPTGKDDPVPAEKVSEDVIETNPAPESMESRG